MWTERAYSQHSRDCLPPPGTSESRIAHTIERGNHRKKESSQVCEGACRGGGGFLAPVNLYTTTGKFANLPSLCDEKTIRQSGPANCVENYIYLVFALKDQGFL